MNRRGTERIETKRLILRPFIAEDAQYMFHNWASDDEVTKYLMWPTHKKLSISENVLNAWVNNYNNKSYYQWAIVIKTKPEEPIGCIGVNNEIDDIIKMAHIGYCIGRRWWNTGIASEALKSVVEYLFEKVGVNRIESRHDPRNPNSGAVMRKCGMHYEGTLKQSDWNNQGVCDACYYALLAEDR